MAKNLLNKYVWLVETIYKAGRITFGEINQKWLDNDLSGGVELPLRTFHKWRIAAEEMFGLMIECERKGGYQYFISNADEINEQLEQKLTERLDMAGIEVIEARMNSLAYAPEIAAVMLRRQQADAIISAREKIVEGAVSMVKMAIDQLADNNVVELDEERKAAMVSNLLVVLCSDESAQPVVNAGTLHH